jgi:hypothetical protein
MAAGSTYTPIATTTLAAPATSYTFSSISGSYTDLYLVVNGTPTLTAYDVWIRLNGDSGSNYSSINIYGTGSAAQSQRESNVTFLRIDRQGTWRSGNRMMIRANVMNYSNSTTYKTVISRSDAPADAAEAIVGIWRNTAAITSIEVGNDATATFAIGTTFTLYGIASA